MDIREMGLKVWTGCIWLMIWTSSEHDNATSGSTKGGQFAV